MKSKTTVKVREAFAKLPKYVQEQARKSYLQFKQNPWYPGLHFKQVHESIPIYSARAGRGYRTVGQRTEDAVVWFGIGSHEDYDKLLSHLCQ